MERKKSKIIFGLIIACLCTISFYQSFSQCGTSIRNIQCPNGIGSNNCVLFARAYFSCFPHGLNTLDDKIDTINNTNETPPIGSVAIIDSCNSPNEGHVGIVLTYDTTTVTVAQGGSGCQVRKFDLDKVLGYWVSSCASSMSLPSQ